MKKAYIAILCGLFFVLDQALKWYSLYGYTEKNLFFSYFGWNPFKNYGVAFGLPLPNWLIISFSLPVLIVLLSLLKKSAQLVEWIGLFLVITGAVSNLFDRIFYRFTVDYILIFTGVVNIGDIMIVTGFLLYFFSAYKHKGGYVSKT